MIDELKKLEEKVAILQDSNGHLCNERDYLQSVIAERNEKISRLQKENAELEAKYKLYRSMLDTANTTEEEYAKIDDEMADLKSDINYLETRLDKAKIIMSKLLRGEELDYDLKMIADNIINK